MMRPSRPAVAALLTAAIAFETAAGQQPAIDFTSSGSPRADVETDHLTVRTPAIERSVTPGARIPLVVEVSPKPGMHVYAPAQQQYIPVSLTLEKSEVFTPRAPVFPPAEKYFFKPLEETQLVYTKPFRIVQEITVAAMLPARERGQTANPALTVSGTLRYQACDDAICYLPKTIPVRWTVGQKPQR